MDIYGLLLVMIFSFGGLIAFGPYGMIGGPVIAILIYFVPTLFGKQTTKKFKQESRYKPRKDDVPKV